MSEIVPAKLHPDDLAVLKEACERSIARTPEQHGRQDATGADAIAFRSMVREEIDNSLRPIIRDEINKDRQENRDACRRMIHDEAEDFVKREVPKIFSDLDMPIDEARIIDTRKKLGRLFEADKVAQRFKGDLLKELMKAIAWWAFGTVTAGLTYLGFRQGGGH